MARDVLDDAETLLEAVLELAPDYQAARYDYADVLARRHKYAQARGRDRAAAGLEPDNPDYRALAATAAVGLGDNEAAIGSTASCWPRRRSGPTCNLWIGHALKTVGRVPEAIEAYRAAAAARPASATPSGASPT